MDDLEEEVDRNLPSNLTGELQDQGNTDDDLLMKNWMEISAIFDWFFGKAAPLLRGVRDGQKSRRIKIRHFSVLKFAANSHFCSFWPKTHAISCFLQFLVSLNSFSTMFGARRSFHEEPVLGYDLFELLLRISKAAISVRIGSLPMPGISVSDDHPSFFGSGPIACIVTEMSEYKDDGLTFPSVSHFLSWRQMRSESESESDPIGVRMETDFSMQSYVNGHFSSQISGEVLAAVRQFFVSLPSREGHSGISRYC
jgi:hypothetical protein